MFFTNKSIKTSSALVFLRLVSQFNFFFEIIYFDFLSNIFRNSHRVLLFSVYQNKIETL